MSAASARIARQRFDEKVVVEIVMDAYRKGLIAKGLGHLMPAGMIEGAPRLEIRRARPRDARALARLHATEIATGFLPLLGPRFMKVLYEALISWDDAVVLVVDDGGGPIAFTAGVLDVGAFYNHFASKHDILIAGLLRGHDQLQESLRVARAEGHGPADVLRRLSDAYVDLTLDQTDLIGVLSTESVHLGDEAASRQVRDVQRAYIQDWVAIARAHNPADSPTVAEALSRLGNVTLLERPVRVAALVSAVQAARKARQRQYQIRIHLAEQQRRRVARAPFRISSRPAITHCHVQHPVWPPLDIAAVVVSVRLIDVQQHTFGIDVERTIGADRVLGDDGVAVVVGVVEPRKGTVGGEGDAEQSLLAARARPVGQVGDFVDL